MMVRFWGNREGDSYEKILPFRKCLPEDWASFPPPAEESEGLFKQYMTDPDRDLFCLDWNGMKNEMEIWGIEDDQNNYQRLEFLLVPCNYVHMEFSNINDSIAEECIADK